MCILIYMHIYITEDNEKFLRSHSGSMSGLINELLDEHRGRVQKAMYKPKQTLSTDPIRVDGTSRQVESIPKRLPPVDKSECPRHHVPKDICKCD